jgi:hypothetical protein
MEGTVRERTKPILREMLEGRAKVNAITRIRIEDIRQAAVKVRNTQVDTWQQLCTLLTEEQINNIYNKQKRIDIMIGIKETLRLARKATRLKINNQCCNKRHRCEDIRQAFRQRTNTNQQQQNNKHNRQPHSTSQATTAPVTTPTQGQAPTSKGAPENTTTPTPTTP